MLSATETSSQPAANMPLPRQSGGAKPMACSRPSRRSRRAASTSPAAGRCSGDVPSISSTSASGGSARAERRASGGAAELVVVATRWDSAIATVRARREPLAGKVVVSMANALVKEGREMLALIPPRGSVAAAIQAALPESRVAAAFHHLPAAEMEDLESGLVADVLVCSDHAGATAATVGLVERMHGLRPL